MRRFLLVFCCVCCLLPGRLWADDIDALRKERQAVLDQIKKTEQALSANQKSVKNQMYRYTLLNDRVKDTEKYLRKLNEEYNRTCASIRRINEEQKTLQAQLDQRKEQYAKMVRQLYVRLNDNDRLMFIFSARDFGQSMRRMRYLNEYSRNVRQAAEDIQQKQVRLDALKAELETTRQAQAKLVAEQKAERDNLRAERNKMDATVRELRRKGKALDEEKRRYEQKSRRLNNRIEEIIAEENRQSSSSGNKVTYEMTVDEKKLSADFGSNKGKLPFPVSQPGTVVVHFGQAKHQDMKYVQTNSSGIDIQTSPGASARAIFNGTVSKVFTVQGTNFSIIVRHGNYLSVYSNIDKVSVKAGQTVKTGQTLGTIYVDKAQGDQTIMHFQIWKDLQKMDPELWIKRR